MHFVYIFIKIILRVDFAFKPQCLYVIKLVLFGVKS